MRLTCCYDDGIVSEKKSETTAVLFEQEKNKTKKNRMERQPVCIHNIRQLKQHYVK